MDNSMTESVESTFGSEFQQYCAHHEIPLEKNKCGAFMVPNASALREWIDTLERYEDKDYRGNIRLKNRQENFCIERTNITPPSFLANLRLKLDLRDTSSILPSYTVHTAPKGYILNTAKNGEEIYESILKRTMKDTVVVDYKASVPSISLILESLQKRHKRFHYYQKDLNSKEKCDQELKCKH